ncbi:MAG: hypothetical protein AB7I79_16970 [Rhizobiaceae bacterium]
MTLQNRVDPFGRIVADPARGMFTGNRGIIHDPSTRTLLRKRWSTPHWIICACRYKDRPPRDVMGYNPRGGSKAGWTELFFLDEPTALATGHRPCFNCRRERAKDFIGLFAATSGIAAPKVNDLDRRLHAERLASGGKPPVIAGKELRKLPDGAFVGIGERAFAVKRSRLLPWKFKEYEASIAFADRPVFPILLLTPSTTVEVLRAGYRPEWHASAFA